MRIPDPIRVHAQITPDELALIDGDASITYRQLDNAICGVADQLSDLGITAGSKVGFVAGSDIIRTIVSLFAVLRCRAIAFPMSGRLPPAAIDEYRSATDCVMISSSKLPEEEAPSVSIDWTYNDRKSTRIEFLNSQATATIVATSGSSGMPKLAVHQLRSHFYSAWDSYDHIPLVQGDRWLLTIPLNHVGGLGILFRSFMSGSTVVVGLSSTLAADVYKNSITHVSLVATQLMRFLDSLDAPPDSLKSVLVGGSAIPSSLLRRAISMRLPVQVTYGMTESGSQIATTPVLKNETDVSVSGSIMRHLGVRIVDGVVEIRGPHLFAGYYMNGSVVNTVDAGGWFRTGDRGEFVGESLRITGRVDNMFVSGGENIQPEEIEFHLYNIEGVKRAVVVAVPHEEYGWRPVAFVDADVDLHIDNANQQLESKLPRYKMPIRYLRLPEEYLDVSKIDRADLQKRAIRLFDSDN